MNKAARATKSWQGSKWIRPEKRTALYARDGWCCVYCACGLSEMDPQNMTLDHVRPVELGGTNAATNLVTACRTCNSMKQDKPLAKFLRYLAERGFSAEVVARRVRNATRRTYNVNKTAAVKAA